MQNQALTVLNLMLIWIYIYNIYKEDTESLIDALEITS